MKLALALILTLLAVPQAQARALQSTNGAWIIHDLVIDIFNCQNAVCGKSYGCVTPSADPINAVDE
jgi:hypothetical protein